MLDDMGESARPTMEALKKATKLKGNKYVGRVANHALAGLGENVNQKY